MSYARLSEDSDVYIYPDVAGYLSCCFCSLTPVDFDTTDVPALCKHLDAHRAAGHQVPEGLDELLWRHFPTGTYDPASALLPDPEPELDCGDPVPEHPEPPDQPPSAEEPARGVRWNEGPARAFDDPGDDESWAPYRQWIARQWTRLLRALRRG